jgi:hypothetical protein
MRISIQSNYWFFIISIKPFPVNLRKYHSKGKTMQVATLKKEFAAYVTQAIEETLNYCLGEANAQIVFKYFEEINCPVSSTAEKAEIFSEELRNILGFGHKQILCAASIIEEAILEMLIKKIGVKYELKRPPNFPQDLAKLGEQYENMRGRR